MGAAALTPKNMTDMTQWQGFMRGWAAGYSVVTHTGLERYVSDSSVTVMKHDDKITLQKEFYLVYSSQGTEVYLARELRKQTAGMDV